METRAAKKAPTKRKKPSSLSIGDSIFIAYFDATEKPTDEGFLSGIHEFEITELATLRPWAGAPEGLVRLKAQGHSDDTIDFDFYRSRAEDGISRGFIRYGIFSNFPDSKIWLANQIQELREEILEAHERVSKITSTEDWIASKVFSKKSE